MVMENVCEKKGIDWKRLKLWASMQVGREGLKTASWLMPQNQFPDKIYRLIDSTPIEELKKKYEIEPNFRKRINELQK